MTKNVSPKCPKHSVDMQFVPVENRWECTNPDCTSVKYPRSVVEEGKPLVGRGPIDLLTYVDPDNVVTYILRATGNNVCIDITELVQQLVGLDGERVLLSFRPDNFIDIITHEGKNRYS